MNRKRIAYLHIFIWLFAISANLLNSGIRPGMQIQVFVSMVIGFLYLMVVFYLFYLFLAPALLKRKRLVEFLAISLLTVLIVPFFGYLLLYLSRALFEGSFSNFLKGYTLKMHMSAFSPVLTAAIFGSFFRVIIDWFATMNQKAEIDRQKLSVELDLLKSKLNPHFLFNTLNNIDSLIQTRPDEASSALIRLSEMMRYLTYETSTDFVQLEKEKEYIGNFIELHRMRIMDPAQIQFTCEGDMAAGISPALFVPLLENAFKYATFGGRRQPAISMSLKSGNGIIEFEIANSYDSVHNSVNGRNSGFGINSLTRRLELLYPGRHELVIEKDDDLFRVKVTIAANENQLYCNR